MDFTNDDTSSDKDSELNLDILEEHFEEINVDPVLENKEQVDNLIKKYIKVIALDCADEQLKKKMIRKLCDLRLRQCELLEEQELKLNGENTLCGHQFKLETTTNFCDICIKRQSGIYIPILNNLSTYGQSNVCIYCGYSIHVECQSELFNNKKIRECPKLLYERQMITTSPTKELNYRFVILDICVEKALSDQQYKCNDCKELINFETSQLCDYDGYYYCKNCHNNDQAIIPARVLHNWDFSLRSVSKSSFYILNFVKNKPVLFNLLELNSMLYGFIDELPIVKRLRYELNLMIKYIILCKKPTKPKITISNHLIDSEQINCYSLTDLQDLALLKKNLTDFHSELFDHITKNCETCKGNGFYCELCPDKGGILFPFSPNISLCPRCHAVFHKNCYYRKKTCTRCKRIEKKETISGESIQMEVNKQEMKLKNVDTEVLESKENMNYLNNQWIKKSEDENDESNETEKDEEDDNLVDGKENTGKSSKQMNEQEINEASNHSNKILFEIKNESQEINQKNNQKNDETDNEKSEQNEKIMEDQIEPVDQQSNEND